MYRPCYTRKMTKEEYEAFHEGWLKRRAMDAKRRAANFDLEGHIAKTVAKIRKGIWKRKRR
ncbi:hypothetical protein [Megasphaera elsdenii]|uniref:hypothetical protein n=1 Tax=Megasphaera elsdenii TaxID=907 RepID=UPI0033912C83